GGGRGGAGVARAAGGGRGGGGPAPGAWSPPAGGPPGPRGGRRAPPVTTMKITATRATRAVCITGARTTRDRRPRHGQPAHQLGGGPMGGRLAPPGRGGRGRPGGG